MAYDEYFVLGEVHSFLIAVSVISISNKVVDTSNRFGQPITK